MYITLSSPFRCYIFSYALYVSIIIWICCWLLIDVLLHCLIELSNVINTESLTIAQLNFEFLILISSYIILFYYFRRFIRPYLDLRTVVSTYVILNHSTLHTTSILIINLDFYWNTPMKIYICVLLLYETKQNKLLYTTNNL